MLRFLIFATLIAISLAKAGSYHKHRFRRNEGNEDSVKYHRPKYVYKFHEEDDDDDEELGSSYHDGYKSDYKYNFKGHEMDEGGEEEEEGEKEYKNYVKHQEPEKVTHYGYTSSSSSGSDEGGVQQDTEHHVEIKHEHGTSHQSFKMHHFHPAKVFIKKQDLHYLKKPVEVAVTKHSFKFVHPKTKSYETTKLESYPPKAPAPKKYEFSDHNEHFDLKEYEQKHQFKHKDHFKSPKYEYHVSKEMEVQPKKKIVYHEYIAPPTTYEKKVETPKKYEWKDHHYHYSKPKVEYQHYQQYPYHKEPQQQYQNYKHTVYRGNNESSEEQMHQYEFEQDKSEEEAPHDIHVYH